MDIAKSKNYGAIGSIKEQKGITKAVKDFKNSFLKAFPVGKDDHSFHHIYTYRLGHFLGLLDFYIRLWEFLDLPSSTLEDLRRRFFDFNNSEINRTKEKFTKNIDRLLKILPNTDKMMTSKLILLDKLECHRMYEAIECLDKGRYLASVVMAVSAVENRLRKLLEKANKNIFKQEFERTTLGGIIELFRTNSRYSNKKYDKFKKILPDKHRPLIEMLNIYRIFSAHPKDELISAQTAKNINSLSFLLLLDPDLKV